MRRTPTTDTITAALAQGATTQPGFGQAYRDLAEARAAYDAALGDPDRVPDLAHAVARLQSARRAMRSFEMRSFESGARA